VYFASVIFLIVATTSLAIDLPVARFSLSRGVPKEISAFLSLAEVFAHGAGVAVILLAVWVLDPCRRRHLPRLLVCAFGSGLVAQSLKQVISRTRPRQFGFDGSVWDTFLGWGPTVSSGDLANALDRTIQSFPSGHTATAVGLALGLSRLYPHGRWLFALFAFLAACQRIDVGAHFVSDTFAAAAVGCLIVGLMSDVRFFGSWFDRFEEGRASEGSKWQVANGDWQVASGQTRVEGGES
jgi:membrane-associated phospholipid phosphatase